MTPEIALKMQELRDEVLSSTPFIKNSMSYMVAQEYYTQGFEDAVKLLMENGELLNDNK